MSSLLARFAENAYWMARYVERAENLARILDVNETFARDSKGTANWLTVLQLNQDEERFFAKHAKANATEVLHFYVADPENPTSIVSAVRSARENARSLRHLISTEVWVQLNMFHNRLGRLRRSDYTVGNLSRLCSAVKESCQTHVGVVEGTLYRDQTWCFSYLGKYLERADQTSRLLDIAYRQVLQRYDGDIGSIDSSEFNALLRQAAGYHAFRREQRGLTTPQKVAAFLMYDPRFPRSMTTCVRALQWNLQRLNADFGIKSSADLRQAHRDLAALVRRRAARRLFDDHDIAEWVDDFQRGLIGFDRELGRAFFGRQPDGS